MPDEIQTSNCCEENGAAENELVADEPGQDERGEEYGSKRGGGEPGLEGAMIHVGRVYKRKRHDAEQRGIGERDQCPKRAEREPQLPRVFIGGIEREDEDGGK